ncbi:MAG TPA: 30S ribosome-binding factor RbfA [Chloroflexota bacterium]|nr:30S ribosome-binding factor RbfA [Chloroflexota bacterium]
MSRRIERVNELIKAEIAELLQREVSDPRLSSLVSILAVDTSPDLRNATVRVSVLGSEEETEQSMAALRRARGFLRHELAGRLVMRQVPELSFKLDTSIAEGSKMLEMIKQIEQGETPQDEER